MRFLKLSILPLFLFSSFGYAEKLSFPLAIEKAKSFVVHIIIKDSIQNKSLSSGTGFLLEDKNGEVVLVTAFHVISDLKEGRSLHIETRSGKRIPFQGIKHLQISASVDLAVIKVKWVGKALKWGEVSNNEVYSLGFPSGQFRKVKGDNINLS